MAMETTTLKLTARDVQRMQPAMAELLTTLRKAAALADLIGLDRIEALHQRGHCQYDEVRQITEEFTLKESARSIACVMALNNMAVPADDADASEPADGVESLRRIQEAAAVIVAEVSNNADGIDAACNAARQDESAIHELLKGDAFTEMVDLETACANILHRHRMLTEAAARKARIVKVQHESATAEERKIKVDVRAA
jgi:hypothetical protein